MKVLIIDPSNSLYSQKLAESVGRFVDLKVASCYHNKIPDGLELFYKHSSNINNRILRKLIRGLEYLKAYLKIYAIITKENFDIVHVQWALLPAVDKFFWKLIKKKNIRLIYTAHDPLPHNMNKHNLDIDKDLYAIPDTIVVHSKISARDLRKYFPECNAKIYVQKHGVYNKSKPDISIEKNKYKDLLKKVGENTFVIGFIGRIDYYKGIDLLIEAWNKIRKTENDVYLLIVGATADEYQGQFKEIIKTIKNDDKVFIYNKRYTDSEEEFFYSLCDIVALPYRSASASGVFFSAAQHDKTILITPVDSLQEYIEPVKDDIFTCQPSAYSIYSSLKEITKINNSKNYLKDKGIKFSKKVYEYYSWNKIGMELVNNCYDDKEKYNAKTEIKE